MIEISTSLDAAAHKRSRTPRLRVTVAPGTADPSTMAGVTLPHRIHRFQAGNGFYIATAFEYTYPDVDQTIYYKRMTTVSSASDWNSGWSSVDTATDDGWASAHHDMLIQGNRVIIAYEKSAGVVYARESTDQGQSFGAAYQVVDLSGSVDHALYIAIADQNTIYVGTYNDTLYEQERVYRISRSSPAAAWSSDGPWDFGDHFITVNGGRWSGYLRSIWAREVEAGDHFIMMNTEKGYADDSWYTTSRIRVKNGTWGIARPAFGNMEAELDYGYAIGGISREVNGFYFALVIEEFHYRADETGYDTTYDLFLARTEDGISYQLIPTRLTPTAIETDIHLMAGVALDENGENFIIPTASGTSRGAVHTVPASLFFGADAFDTDVSDDLVGDISIASQVRAASRADIQLSNLGGEYTDHADLVAGAMVRIAGGYRTSIGDEYQTRMTGFILNTSRPAGHDKVAGFQVLDMLYKATGVKQMRPHLLRGQNVFFADFADELAIDKFVSQGGAWAVSAGFLVADHTGVSLSLCGYEPDDAHLISAKVRAIDSITGVKMGIAVHCRTNEDGEQIFRIFRYNKTNVKWEYVEYSVDTDTWVVISDAAAPSWLANTNYWLMAILKHGSLDCFYSTDGVSWSVAMSGISLGWHNSASTKLAHAGYVGLYAERSDDTPTIGFDDILVTSLYPPITDSDVMRYLGTVAGMGRDEQIEIDDDFVGSSFSSRWSTPGTEAVWWVSGGYAKGYISGGTGPGLLRTGIRAADVVVKSDVVIGSYYAGVLVRGDSSLSSCYIGMVKDDAVQIRKKVSDSWTTLFSRAMSLNGTVEVVFMARGGYLSMFVDDVLAAVAYDESIEEGFVGIATGGFVGNETQHDSFSVDAFYIPRDIVIVRPNDNLSSVMSQIADCYDGGEFFANVEGDLKWGVFDGTDVDLDATGLILEISIDKMNDQIISAAKVIGTNCYAELRDSQWGTAFAGYRFQQQQANVAFTGSAAQAMASRILAESQKRTRESIVMVGHPGLELCDVITTQEPGGLPKDRRVMGIQEAVGSAYQMSMSEVQVLEEETP